MASGWYKCCPQTKPANNRVERIVSVLGKGALVPAQGQAWEQTFSAVGEVPNA